MKIKDEGDQRQAVKDYLMLKIYEAITQLKSVNEETQILEYKATLETNPDEKKKH
jgi:hypothetical protein